MKMNMKKTNVCFWAPLVAAAIFAGSLAGCPTAAVEDHDSAFFKKAPVLTLAAGGDGELVYEWTEAVPNNDVEYKLFIMEGEYTDAEALVAAKKTAVITKKEAWSGVRKGLQYDKVYSAVVVATHQLGGGG